MAITKNQNNKTYFSQVTIIVKVLSLLIGCLVLFFSSYTFIFFCAAMVPTMVMIVVDRRIFRCGSATVCAFNLVGVLPYLTMILHSASMDDAAKSFILDTKVWALIYGFAIFGQMVYWIVPIIFARLYFIKTKVEVSILQANSDKVCSDWGIKLDSLYTKSKKEQSL